MFLIVICIKSRFDKSIWQKYKGQNDDKDVGILKTMSALMNKAFVINTDEKIIDLSIETDTDVIQD